MAHDDSSLHVLTLGLLSLTLAVFGPMVFDGLLATMLVICGALAGLAALTILFGMFGARSDPN